MRANHYQPDAEEAGQEARSVYQQAEWKEPQARKDQVSQINLVVQVEEQHSESFSLRLVEDRQEIGAANQDQGGSVIGVKVASDFDRPSVKSTG